MSDKKVCVAYVHGTEVAHSWHQSLMALIAHDVANRQHVIGGGWLATRYGTGGIVQARNDTAAAFTHGQTADWLMWFDTDMGFEANAVDLLFEQAHPEKRPIVGGLCFMNREVGHDGVGGFLIQPAPTIFDWVDLGEQQGFQVRMEYERDQMTQCGGTGSAFVLIHRSVFEKIEAEYGPTWYSPVRNPSTGTTISEDLSFCIRASALDIPIHVHTGVKTTHYKHMWLDERIYDRMEPLADA